MILEDFHRVDRMHVGRNLQSDEALVKLRTVFFFRLALSGSIAGIERQAPVSG